MYSVLGKSHLEFQSKAEWIPPHLESWKSDKWLQGIQGLCFIQGIPQFLIISKEDTDKELIS